MSNKKDEHENTDQESAVPQSDEPMSILERDRGKYDFVLLEHDFVEANTKLIGQLHDDIIGYLAIGLEKAFQIGELLFELKKRIQYGSFTRWAMEYLPFKIRTAQNYMKLYRYKDELMRKNITTISDAYAALKGEPTPDEVIDIDDSLDTKGKWVVVETTVKLDNITLPKKNAKGMITRLTINEEVISRIHDEDYPFDKDSREMFAKIVVGIPNSERHDSDLVGEFIFAATKLLQPGGKLIFHKK